MNSIKSELEDLSFKYIDPDAFHDIAQKVGLRRTEREENIRMVISELSEKLDARTSTTRWTAAPSTCIPSTRR